MLGLAAQWLSVLAGVWLIGLGVWMLFQPRQALRVLGRMGGSPAIHAGEMSIRILAGLALLLAAEASRHPPVIAVVGGFLILSAIVLLLLPRRLHATFSTWWAQRIPVAAVRLIGPLSWLMGGALIWEVWPWR